MPKFSIIIPVYNVEKYLRECLDSVVSQTYTDYEAICVDDGSTDHSSDILQEYALKNDRLKVVRQDNGGLSAARNTGMRQAQGEYILFLDSDDTITEDTLETLNKNLDGEDILCFNGFRYHDETGKQEQTDTLTPEKHITGWDYYCRYALQQRDFAFVCVVLRLYKRTFLVEKKLFFEMNILHEDNIFTPQACLHARDVSVINDILYKYRLRGGSIMTTASLQHNRDMVRIANYLTYIFIKQKGINKGVIYRAITHHYQVALAVENKEDKKDLAQVVDWALYHHVASTRLRHRINYWKNRITTWK